MATKLNKNYAFKIGLITIWVRLIGFIRCNDDVLTKALNNPKNYNIKAQNQTNGT